MFLYDVGRCCRDVVGEMEIVKAPCGDDLKQQVRDLACSVVTGQRARPVGASGSDELRQPVGDEMMLIAAFLCDDRFDDSTETSGVAVLLSFN